MMKKCNKITMNYRSFWAKPRLTQVYSENFASRDDLGISFLSPILCCKYRIDISIGISGVMTIFTGQEHFFSIKQVISGISSEDETSIPVATARMGICMNLNFGSDTNSKSFHA